MLQPKIVQVEPMASLTLRLTWETGETNLFDVAPYALGSWYGELCDPAYFRTVRLIDGGAGIEWANGQDLAPHELYDLGVLCDPARDSKRGAL